MTDALASRLHPGIARGHAAHGEEGTNGLILGEQAIGVGHEDSTQGVAVVDRDLTDRTIDRSCDLICLGEQRHLVGLGNIDGSDLNLVATISAVASEGNGANTATTSASSSRRRRRSSDETLLAEIGGMGEACGVADDDTNARTAVAARGELLDPTVIEQRRRTAPILGEDLGELPARSQGRTQDSLQH